MNYNEITSFRGTISWYHREGFYYTVRRRRNHRRFLECASDACRAKWTLSDDGSASEVRPNHNHEQTPWVPSRNEMYQALKRRASDPMEHMSLINIFQEEVLRHPEGAPHLLFHQVESSMRSWRQGALPAVPRTLREYADALGNHPEYSSLLLATVEAGSGVAVILVMSGFGQCLSESSTIFADGTFATVPAGLSAYQILTIHAAVAGYFFHPVLVLMQNRTRILYEAVLQRIWQSAGNPRPLHIVTDFEPALQGALQSVANMQVQGCLFHFLQALLRRARMLGLAMHHNSPGAQLVHLYGALALLPAHQVALGLAEVPAIAAATNLPFNQAFHDYFVSHWMGRVQPATFSVCGSPHQTTNVAESFHSTLKKNLRPHPNIWKFTAFVRTTFAYCEARRAAVAIGNPPRRTRVRHYARRTDQMRTVSDLSLGRITIREFVVTTSQLMTGARVFQPVWEIVDDVPEAANEVVLGEEAEREPELVIEVPAAQAEVPVVLEVEVPAAPLSPPMVQAVAPPVEPVGRCSICIENLSNRVLVPCGHTLCADCLRSIEVARPFIAQCPFCRSVYDMAVTMYL